MMDVLQVGSTTGLWLAVGGACYAESQRLLNTDGLFYRVYVVAFLSGVAALEQLDAGYWGQQENMPNPKIVES